MARIDVLDGQLVALELILALHRVGSGARHADTDEHRIARHAGRPRAERLLVGGQGFRCEPRRQRQATGDAEAGADELAAAIDE